VKDRPVATVPPKRKSSVTSRARKKLLGERVRAYRLGLGLSQEALADKCGLHRNYVSSIERGLVNVSFDNLVTLSAGLEVDVGELVSSIS
jgi:transcriptional regulator with XRE-family HTH domain